MLSQLVVYLIVDNVFTPPARWVLNLNFKCGTTPVNQSFDKKSMVQAGVFSVGYGAYLGILLYRKLFDQFDYLTLRTNWYKYLLRYLVMAVMSLPFGLIILFTPWTGNLAVLIIFKTLIPCFVVGFLLFAFS
jgi:hypothetical protein